MKEHVQIGAILDSISTRKDRSVKLVFETNEIPDAQAAALFAMRDAFGWVTFSPTQEQVEVPDEPPPEFQNQKSLSKRLYDVLFVWWKQSKQDCDFEAFRKGKMETFIQWIKDNKLDATA
jgi:hypothetical protein